MATESPEQPQDNKDPFAKSRRLNDELLVQGGARIEVTGDQLEAAHAEMLASQRDVRTEEEKQAGEAYHKLNKDEIITVPLDPLPDGYDPSKPYRVMDTFKGAEVFGVKVKSLNIGSRDEPALLEVLDISGMPVARTEEDRPVHSIGHDSDDRPIEIVGEHALLVRTPSLRAFDVPLEPGRMVFVGRDTGKFGADVPSLLPDTVSRDHCAIGLTRDGQLRVENHYPSNDTAVLIR